MKKAVRVIGLACLGLAVLGSVGALGAMVGGQNREAAAPVPEPSVVVSVSPSPFPVEVAAPPQPAPASPIPAPPPPAPIKTSKPKAAQTAKAAPVPVAPPPAPPAVAAPAPAPPPPPPPAPPPPPPPAPEPITPRVLWEGSGSSNQTTPKFTTQGSDWDMEWSFDCTAYGYESNFIVWVDGPGYLQPVNELSMGGSGVQHYHTGGTFFLEITSSCSWHVKVIG